MERREEQEIDFGRSDRHLAIAFKLALAAAIPFFGILAGFASIWIASRMLAEPGYSRSQRASMVRVIALAAAFTLLWIWLLARSHLH